MGSLFLVIGNASRERTFVHFDVFREFSMSSVVEAFKYKINKLSW
jgi:hypothetical protein